MECKLVITDKSILIPFSIRLDLAFQINVIRHNLNFNFLNRHYRTCLSPRQVLDRLEVEGYTVIGVQTINGWVNADGAVDAVSQWTLHKQNRPCRSISDSSCEPK